MKIQKLKMPYGEQEALRRKINEALRGVEYDSRFGQHLVAVDSDFAHTTNVKDARYLYSDSYTGSILIMLDAAGNMLHIVDDD